MKKEKGDNSVLIIVSVASMIEQFLLPSIHLLEDMGYEVDVAANFLDGNTCTDVTIKKLHTKLCEMGVDCYQIDFERNICRVIRNARAYQQLKDALKQKKYSFVHCHSPIGGFLGRIAARRYGIKAIYTAHGFHFYDGAPFVNWMLYFPIEKALSHITDILVTINKEDYRRAKRRLHAKATYYVPGVGIDVSRFIEARSCRDEKREELGIGEKDVLILSVGELNKNKNHEIIIRALGRMKEADSKKGRRLTYFIAGKGKLRKKLLKCAAKNQVDLRLLGYCDDIPQLLAAADLFLLPSKREGLNVGLLEAVARGLPCIASDIRGNRDVLEKRGSLVKVHDLSGWVREIGNKIRKLDEGDVSFGEDISQYDERYVMARMRKVYGQLQARCD